MLTGHLLRALDAAHPVPEELGGARDYGWAHTTWAAGELQDFAASGEQLVLYYFLNLSGGEPIIWKLVFSDAREAIDFLIVGEAALECEDDSESDAESLDARRLDGVLELGPARLEALQLLAEGASPVGVVARFLPYADEVELYAADEVPRDFFDDGWDSSDEDEDEGEE